MKIVSSIKPTVAMRLGAALLIIPVYFIIASVLRQNAPGLRLLASPAILLGALFAAFGLNALPILSVDFRHGTPPVLNVSLSLRAWNLAVICASTMLLWVLVGYVFVENFQMRPAN